MFDKHKIINNHKRNALFTVLLCLLPILALNIGYYEIKKREIEGYDNNIIIGNYKLFTQIGNSQSHLCVLLLPFNNKYKIPDIIKSFNILFISLICIFLLRIFLFNQIPAIKLKHRFILNFLLASTLPLSLLIIISYSYLRHTEESNKVQYLSNLANSINEFETRKEKLWDKYVSKIYDTQKNDEFIKLLEKNGTANCSEIKDKLIDIFYTNFDMPLKAVYLADKDGIGTFLTKISNQTESDEDIDNKSYNEILHSLEIENKEFAYIGYIDKLDGLHPINKEHKIKFVTNSNNKYNLNKEAFEIAKDAMLQKTSITRNINNYYLTAIPAKNFTNMVFVGACDMQKITISLKEGEETSRKTDCVLLYVMVKNFDNIAKTISAENLINELKIQVEYIAKAVLEEGGEIDKIMGDKQLIVFHTFNRTLKECLSAACNAAIKISKIGKSGALPFKSALGINYGSVVTGFLGVGEKHDFTVIGDPVNVSARIASFAGNQETKRYLISSDVYDLIKTEFYGKFIDRIILKGKSQPMEIYSLNGKL